MAAPTTQFLDSSGSNVGIGGVGTGTISATGESSGLLLTITPNFGASPRIELGFSGSNFTSVVVAVRCRKTGLTQYYPPRVVNPNGVVLQNDSTSMALTDSTNQSVSVDGAGSNALEVWVVSGTLTAALAVEVRVTANSAPLTNVLNVTVTGAQTVSGNLAVTGTGTVTSASASAFTAGRLGATTPALQVDASTATSITGVKVKSAASGGGVAVSAVGETNVALTIDANGSGTVTIGGTSTGNVNLGGGGGKVVLPGTLTAGGLLTCALQVATSGPLIYSGSGAPSISAAVKGSLYLRSDGSSTSTRAYIASDTAGTWTALTTAA